jgi:hypothetical protein
LLKSAIAQTTNYFPPVTWSLGNLRLQLCFLILQVQVYVLLEALNINQVAVQLHFDFLVGAASHIVDSLCKQSNRVVIQIWHFEPLEVWFKLNAGKV